MAFQPTYFFKRKKLPWEVIAAVAVVVSLAIILLNLPDTDQEIRMVRLKLFAIRSMVANFHKAEGRYPNTLSELQEHNKENTGSEFDMNFFKEHISSPEGIDAESQVLNGEGGWYYDKIKGEVKLNITHPIKHYKKYYLGKYRNEIPSDW
jgi:hypothetical protein